VLHFAARLTIMGGRIRAGRGMAVYDLERFHILLVEDNGYIAEPPFALVQHPVRRFANDIARGGVDEEVFLFDSDGERRLRERHPDLALALL